jgi:hypothetical protein
MTQGEWRIKLDIPITPREGEMVVVPEESAPRTIRGSGFSRLAEPKNHFEVTLDDGRRCVSAMRVADAGAGGHWFVARWA